jgi:uncharacterized membrane protein YphA (DoxX/SURF4 family)
MNKKLLFACISCLVLFFIAIHSVSAHEVYVLNNAQIAYDASHPSPNPLQLITDPADRGQFLAATIIGVILVGGIFLLSISRWLEDLLDPVLLRIKRFAPIVARLTLGFSLLAAAYYQALFGPELTLTSLVGHYAPIVQIVMYVIAVFIILGLFVRESAFVALGIFIIAVVVHKTYMLTYMNYLGEIVANLILGGGLWSLDRYFAKATIATDVSLWKEKMEPYAFPVLRILFGVSAIYASWYAKLFHSELALDTVKDYHLTTYFHFPALFIVLGALIIESLVGFFFILGIEIRFTALFFLFFLTLSLFFFGEVVWPHLVLIGVNIAFILHGYDQYSLEGHFFEKDDKEPVF